MRMLKKRDYGFVIPTKNVNINRRLLLFLTVVAILGTGCAFFFYVKYRSVKAGPQLESQKETTAIVEAVGKLMELPTDETPSIATISNKERLNDQKFFQTAKNGDVLLAYPVTLKAILYRPETNKIINVAPISMDQPPDADPSHPQ